MSTIQIKEITRSKFRYTACFNFTVNFQYHFLNLWNMASRHCIKQLLNASD